MEEVVRFSASIIAQRAHEAGIDWNLKAWELPVLRGRSSDQTVVITWW